MKSCQNHDKCGILGIGQQYRPPFAATHQWYESFPEMACGILPQKSDIYFSVFFCVCDLHATFLAVFFLNIILLGGARGLLGRQVKRRSSRRLDRHESEGPAIRGWAKKQTSAFDHSKFPITVVIKIRWLSIRQSSTYIPEPQLYFIIPHT